MSSSSSGFSSLMPEMLLRARLIGVRAEATRPSFGSIDDVRRLGLVVLVLDVADDLLDQVLDGDEAVGAAVLVDDQRHVDARRLHADQQVHRRHRRRHVEHRPADLGGRDGARQIDAAEIELLRAHCDRHFLGGVTARRRGDRAS